MVTAQEKKAFEKILTTLKGLLTPKMGRIIFKYLKSQGINKQVKPFFVECIDELSANPSWVFPTEKLQNFLDHGMPDSWKKSLITDDLILQRIPENSWHKYRNSDWVKENSKVSSAIHSDFQTDLDQAVQESLEEIGTTSEEEIERSTAVKWAARSIASFILMQEAASPKEKVDLFDAGDDRRHEALEHAALVGDHGELVGVLQGLIDEEREKAAALLDSTVFSSYPSIARVMAAEKKPVKKSSKKKISKPSVSIPPKYIQFVDGSGDLGNVESWKVQIQSGNSMGRDSPGIGGWDKAGYVFVNPKTKEIVPIARSDEHNTGWDLMYDLEKKGIVKNVDDFQPIYIHGTHVYDREDKEPFKKAFQTWLDAGGKDIKVEIYRSSSVNDNERFIGTLSEFIAAKSFIPEKGAIAKPGRELIGTFGKFGKAVEIALRDPTKDSQAVKQAEAVLHALERYDSFGILKATVLKQAEEALGSGDFQKIQDAFLGMNGLKNSIHQNLREAEGGKHMYQRELEAYFGDVGAAKKAFDALGDI